MFRLFKKIKPEAEPDIRPEVMMLFNLIEMDRDWRKDTFAWYHPVGVCIWVGNKDLGFVVKWNSKDIYDNYAIGHPLGYNLNKDECKFMRSLCEPKKSVDIQNEHISEVAKKILAKYGQKQVDPNDPGAKF